MDGLLLGIDLGTTGCKAVITNSGLDVLGESYIEYGLIELSSKEIEQDANEWWRLVKETVSQAIHNACIDPKNIKSMSVSSQGIAFVPVDTSCRPLRNAISWLDTRAAEETAEIQKKYGEGKVFATTGKRLSEAYTLPKLIWFKKHEPEMYERTYKFLMPHDYILAKLTGIAATDHTMASGTLAYDIRKQDWQRDVLADFGINDRKLPEIRFSGTAAGRICKDAASETGLPDDLLVCIGGQDQKCAAFGAGLDGENITVSLGTATAIEKLCDFPDTGKDMKIPVFSYLFRNKWVLEGVIPTSGICLKWFRDMFMKEQTYMEIDEAAKNAAGRNKGIFFYPYLSGRGSPDWYHDPKGCFFGLDLTADIADMALGILEGTAFQIRSNIEQMKDPAKPPKEIRVFGGGASSGVWCQMIADTTDIPVVTMPVKETACIGACMLAGIGAGMYDTEKRINFGKLTGNTYSPQKNKIGIYESKYREYIRIQNKIMG